MKLLCRLFLIIIILCSNVSYSAENNFDKFEIKKGLIKKHLQKMFYRIPRFPVTLFPESSNEILRRLSISVKNRYYTPTIISSLRVVPEEGKDPWSFLRIHACFSTFFARGLPFEKAELILDNVKINPSMMKYSSDPIRAFKKIGNINFLISANAEKLGKFFINEAKCFNVSLPVLKIEDSKMSVSGKLKILWCNMNIFSIFHPETDRKNQINFIIDKMKMAGLGVPRFIVGKLLKTFNPVIRVESNIIPFKLYPVNTRVTDDSLLIYAKGKL